MTPKFSSGKLKFVTICFDLDQTVQSRVIIPFHILTVKQPYLLILSLHQQLQPLKDHPQGENIFSHKCSNQMKVNVVMICLELDNSLLVKYMLVHIPASFFISDLAVNSTKSTSEESMSLSDSSLPKGDNFMIE